MICQACGGTGEVASRLLWFFTWRRPCPNCAGRGQVGVLGAKKPAPIASEDDDHRGEFFIDRTYDSFGSAAPSAGHAPDDPLASFSGGRSGGAGAGASWGDETGVRDGASHDDRDGPLIVDPFLADGPSPDTSDAGFDDAGSGSDESGSDSDGGTSY